MRIRTLLAATVLGLAALTAAAPASAAPVSAGSSEVITWAASDVSAAVDICRSEVGPRYHKTSCVRAAPGNQYRALIWCSNGTRHEGPWRYQRRSFWVNKSTAWCPEGTHRTDFGWQFRTV